MSFFSYAIRRILATIPMIFGMMFLTFIMIRFMPHLSCPVSNPWGPELRALVDAYIERTGINDPFLIQFYKFLTNMMGLFWTWLILVCCAGYIVFYAYKVVYEKINIIKNTTCFFQVFFF